MAHRNLLDERRAVFSEVPPLKHLPPEKRAPEISLGDTSQKTGGMKSDHSENIPLQMIRDGT